MTARKILLAMTAALTVSSQAVIAETLPSRIVSVGAAVTESLYALGIEERLVGRDQTSLWPPQAESLSDVGYPRNLALEGLLSLNPDLVVVSHDAGPPHVIDGLERSGVEVLRVTTGPSWNAAKQGMEILSQRFSMQQEMQDIISHADQQLKRQQVADQPQKVLFLLAEGPGGWLAAGGSTRADSLISAAKAHNVLGNVRGYRPLSPESILALAPDVILLASHALGASNGSAKASSDEALEDAGLGIVPAVQEGKVIVLDSGQFLTLGPRFGDSVSTLSDWLAGTPEVAKR